MGVRGLWQIVGPVARPVRLESLSNKKLAIDASIWIYHFLKAVRDSKGNALVNAHVIGFFRRICKLLFFGIKPVFVFDGDAPVLKKKTIRRRKERQIGREHTATQTAAKLLTVQLQRLAGETSRDAYKTGRQERKQESLDNNDYVYYDERNLGESERTKPDKKSFRATDQYHLPELDENLAVDANDPRLMTEEELEEYAGEFQHQIATKGLYDTSAVDFNSPEFEALPLATQYQLLNTARLRSRLRMGYTAEQLDELFPDRMEFSRFQIQRVTQRNFFTQRLMGLVGLEEDLTRRIAGQKGGEYVLKRNDSGWSMVLNKTNQGSIINIDAEEGGAKVKLESDDDLDDVDWEDIELEEKKTQGWSSVDNSSMPEILSNFESQLQQEKPYERQMETTWQKSQPIEQKLEKELFGVVDKKVAASEVLNNLPTLDYVPEDVETPSWGSGCSQSRVTSLLLGDMRISKEAADSQASAQASSQASGSNANNALTSAKITEQKAEAEARSKKSPAPIPPPWFAENQVPNGQNIERDTLKRREDEDQELIPYKELGRVFRVSSLDVAEPEVVDLSSDEESKGILETKATLHKISREPEQIDLTEQENTVAEMSDVRSPLSQWPGATAPRSMLIEEPSERESDKPQVSTQSPESQTTAPIDIQQAASADTAVELESFQSKDSPVLRLTEHDEELAAAEALYDQEEDEELLENLTREFIENERFIQSLNNKHPGKSKYEMDAEIRRLTEEQRKAMRDADGVTQTMISECQELLRRFGIPYITAPMEAEAQCGTLMELGLVDGIVTDDSDCFLFGGTKVYKNMFNQSKYVELYDMADLEREFALDRKKLIKLAYLLGSDYTDGLPGVGPVTALELLSEFPTEDGLIQFREWWKKVQRLDPEMEITTEFRKKFKKNARKLQLDDDFPNLNVEQAYLHPQVDDDPTPFEWGVPNLDSLRTFLQGMTGWGQEKVDEVLVPVIQNMNRRLSSGPSSLTQTTLAEYMNVSGMKKVELGSKRMHKAMQSLVDQRKRAKKS